MGAQNLAGMLDTGLDVDAVLDWHLFHNHYPPPPRYMKAVAQEALGALRDGEPDRMVTLPDGVLYRGTQSECRASEIADAFHLWRFMDHYEIEVER